MNEPGTYRSHLTPDISSSSSISSYISPANESETAIEASSDDDDDDVTPPATPTDFSAQVSDLNSHSKDHRRLSSLCLDIREACETRGTNADIKRACRWLLERDGVPQKLRMILWEQLLRDDMQGVDDDGEGDGEGALAALRRTSADPVVSSLAR